MSQHRSVWHATATAPPFPALADRPAGDSPLDVDVAVVGAGITGLTTALLLQRDGARVAVIEADRVGAGTTGGTTGKVTAQHSLIYDELIRRHGEDTARLYAQANQAAIGTVAELVAETGADCQLERVPSFLYAPTADERDAVEAEHAAAVRLGLPASLTTEMDLPVPVEVALRFDDQAHLHPLRYLAALATAVHDRGGHLVERTRATDVDEDGDRAVVHTTGGDVRAGAVVIATLLPFLDAGGFFARTRPTRAYGIAVRLRSEAPRGMHFSVGSPTRSTRPWADGDRPGLIVVGGNHPTGDESATPARWGDLEGWVRQTFDVDEVAYRWSSQDFTTADHLPYVGRSPRTERTYVATGFAKWGLTNGTAAARLLADLVAGREPAELAAFDATRIGDAAAVKKLVADNLKVGARFAADRLDKLGARSAADLAAGEGDLVRLDRQVVAAYRDPGGRLHAVSPTCTHLGCTVHWNAAERSWDCPCHGSRFGTDGAVLDGPAVRPLDPVDAAGPDEPS